MAYYCRVHPDFEGLDLTHLTDHVERDHKDILQSPDWKEKYREFYQENIEISDFRKSDGKMIARTWGRPPKVGSLAENEKDI